MNACISLVARYLDIVLNTSEVCVYLGLTSLTAK